MRRGMRPREVSFSYVSSLGEKSFVKDALYWQGEWNDKRLSMLLDILSMKNGGSCKMVVPRFMQDGGA
ncbi:hypothetical protein Csa_018422 [Cucumis sativus]|uniref:Uncharacterized protein n=1 Tax=Cucumis sativus TaxID=3659 RepID=A0A0A0KPN6_CUCSA|nr:hypothetical protein Csa_018422 [Cucumis sativus]